MIRVSIRLSAVCLAACLFAGPESLGAQSPDDGQMFPKRALSAGLMYSHESWTNYWEGTLKRSNDNIGTLTTQTVALVAGYGLHERFGLSAALPFVSTSASEGTLQGMQGIQDLTIFAKFRLLTTPFTEKGALSVFLTGSAAAPIGDYTPDLVPLSIGTSGRRASARLTLGFRSKSPFYLNASAGYTFCNNVRLDRPSYFNGGQLYMTNEVAMPNVMEYTLGSGYRFGRVQLPLGLVVQRTLGGSDIRRQDMPFISNRMNFTRLDGAALVNIRGNTAVKLGASRILDGRNVGQAFTLTTGVVHAIQF